MRGVAARVLPGPPRLSLGQLGRVGYAQQAVVTCPSGRRCNTRNVVYGNPVPWVQIPPLPRCPYSGMNSRMMECEAPGPVDPGPHGCPGPLTPRTNDRTKWGPAGTAGKPPRRPPISAGRGERLPAGGPHPAPYPGPGNRTACPVPSAGGGPGQDRMDAGARALLAPEAGQDDGQDRITDPHAP